MSGGRCTQDYQQIQTSYLRILQAKFCFSSIVCSSVVSVVEDSWRSKCCFCCCPSLVQIVCGLCSSVVGRKKIMRFLDLG